MVELYRYEGIRELAECPFLLTLITQLETEGGGAVPDPVPEDK